ncbi:hypothetical protein Ahu01nite_059380 [Winogradskya humida]|uniref:Uncharacterized protein n=1 Tax=Winogradskya humida TaxID=113566 RepID=A0ABQ3ZW50_9ACTN|nr:hypothetical protein Ahu01nite_059380 [Actinoplanes humidus]
MLGGGVAAAAGLGAGRHWDLSGFTTVVGDGVYAATGQDPVTDADIALENYGTYSRLRANVLNRGVMAHGISYASRSGSRMMRVTHRAGFSFRLPYLPSQAGGDLNAQTVEGGLFVWDGGLDHGTAFQWVLNPWVDTFGQVMAWTGDSWTPAGYLRPDTAWHTVNFTVDPVRLRVRLAVDGHRLPAPYSRTPKTGWGSVVTARLQAEAISLWPGENATWAPQHEVDLRDWTWRRT